MISINNLTKKIKGKVVLNEVTYDFMDGKIYGLYGRNGSGKTMLLRAIAGLIFSTEGKILVDEKEIHKEISFPPNMGLIIENTSLLPQYDAFTNLKILAKIRNVASDSDIKEAIAAVGLDPESKQLVKTFSLGMKQKLAIAQAIFEKPSLLLLDEPTNALDEESIYIVRNILLEMKEKGATIIVASHNKEDLNILSDFRLKMIDGKLIAS